MISTACVPPRGELNLDADALVALAQGKHLPEVEPPAGFASFHTDFNGMGVNAYLAWDPATREAAAFDTGASAAGMLDTIRAHDLQVKFLLLTHTHPDHIAALDVLTRETGAEVFTPAREPVAGAKPAHAGDSWTVGGLTIGARSTPGHSPGGTTYVVRGLAAPVAVVGDALFAGSQGGVSPENYPAALAANRREILALPPETVIAPGHGPLTTVAFELRGNPFYAGRVG